MTSREIDLLQDLGKLPATGMSMNDPIIYVGIFLFIGAVTIVVKVVFNRLKKYETDLKALEDKIFDATVHKNDCNGKQELWGERFENMMCKFDSHMEQNKQEHLTLISSMEKSAKAHASQIADFAQKLDEMSECIHRLELGKEC